MDATAVWCTGSEDRWATAPEAQGRTPVVKQPAHILVVEDDPDALQLMEMILLMRGYRVSTAVSGRDALNLVAQYSFDLIITDVMMPQMDGAELARHLKANDATKDIPIIVCTALLALPRGMERDVAYFIQKPVDLEGLDVLIHAALRGAVPGRPSASS